MKDGSVFRVDSTKRCAPVLRETRIETELSQRAIRVVTRFLVRTMDRASWSEMEGGEGGENAVDTTMRRALSRGPIVDAPLAIVTNWFWCPVAIGPLDKAAAERLRLASAANWRYCETCRAIKPQRDERCDIIIAPDSKGCYVPLPPSPPPLLFTSKPMWQRMARTVKHVINLSLSLIPSKKKQKKKTTSCLLDITFR